MTIITVELLEQWWELILAVVVIVGMVRIVMLQSRLLHQLVFLARLGLLWDLVGAKTDQHEFERYFAVFTTSMSQVISDLDKVDQLSVTVGVRVH